MIYAFYSILCYGVIRISLVVNCSFAYSRKHINNSGAKGGPRYDTSVNNGNSCMEISPFCKSQDVISSLALESST